MRRRVQNQRIAGDPSEGWICDSSFTTRIQRAAIFKLVVPAGRRSAEGFSVNEFASCHHSVVGNIVALLPSQSACQQELDMVLEQISRMTSEDNRGPLESLYGLKFPNCDRQGLYNLKQVGCGHTLRS